MKKINKIVFALVVLCVFTNKSNAQNGIYMKVAGITGDVVTPAAYANTILLSSYSGGTGRQVTTTSPATTVGKPSVAELSFTVQLNSGALPLLNNMVGNGKGTSAISTVDFYFISGSCACPYYRVHLENVYVSGFAESSGGDIPAMSISIHFDKIAWAFYKANSSTITNTTGFDLVAGTPYSYSFP